MNVINSNEVEHDAIRKPVPIRRHHALGEDPLAFTRSSRRALLAAALLLVLQSADRASLAQGVDCGRLRTAIDAAPADAGYGGALRQQQYELRRTQDYFASIGCDGGLFGTGLFGGGPPQCAGIDARIKRMEANVGRLQEQMQDASGGGGDRRRALIEQYNNACSGGGSENQSPIDDGQMMPVDPDAPPGEQPPPEAPQGRVKALCVRQCDGGYFPITDDASSSQASTDHLGELCKAMCPGTEASLYTTAPSGSLDTAVTPDGTPYTALPAAFKFQKSFDPTCSCKPPHQSWVEALAGAEKLIQSDKADVTVTQKLSDQMSRPNAAAPVETPARKAKAARKAKPAPVPPSGLDDQAGIDIPPPPKDGEDLTRQFRPTAPAL